MDQPYGAAVIVEWEGDVELDMTGALEADSWFGSSARDRERFRQFRHRLPEKIHDHLRKLGLVVIATDYAVPLEKNREMLDTYRGVIASLNGEQLDELDRFHARWQPDTTPTPTPKPSPVVVITPEGGADEPGDTGPGATIYPFRRLRERPEREAR